MRALLFLVATGVLCQLNATSAAPELAVTGWTVARSSHFEVYSDAGPDRAKAALTRFEELRSFFERDRVIEAGSTLQKKAPVRVIAFSSKQEYDAFRIRTMADAYYNGTADRDYIVMPVSGKSGFSVAAHEYAHVVLHRAGLKLPAWLNEGLAELFSTVTITNRRCEFGGPIPARTETLRRHRWLTASELLAAKPESSLRTTRDGASIFYAESWALADMLTSSPEYEPRFSHLIKVLNSTGPDSRRAFEKVYGKSPDAIVAAGRDWIRRARSSRRILTWLVPTTFSMEVNPLSEPQARAMIADLLFADGEWDRAEQMYKEVLRQSPNSPEVFASLGAVALRKGDRHRAAGYWHKALDSGLTDAVLCYRYALLADDMGLPSHEIERALERAIAIQPDFDDARYRLALLKSNAGEFEAAVTQLQSMAKPRPERAFAYWTALAYALSELGRPSQAKSAAEKAMRLAASPEEHDRAAELAYVAGTDLAVRFRRGVDGKPQLTMTRVPHGTTAFNPFIEAEDHIEAATGTLREVQCSGGRLTSFLVESSTRLLTLSVPDPTHVLMRNSPAEFTCGAQAPKRVKVEYATAGKTGAGLLRGMEFE